MRNKLIKERFSDLADRLAARELGSFPLWLRGRVHVKQGE